MASRSWARTLAASYLLSPLALPGGRTVNVANCAVPAPAAFVVETPTRYLPGVSLRVPMRPENGTAFWPLTPVRVSVPTGLNRWQALALRFLRVGRPHVAPDFRPTVILSIWSATLPSSVRRYVNVVPTAPRTFLGLALALAETAVAVGPTRNRFGLASTLETWAIPATGGTGGGIAVV